jgi:phage terminase large subunit GpA-like protein
MEKIKPKSVGFQYNRLDTPWFSFGEVIAEYLNSLDDPSALMNFENSWMAMPYVERAEKKSELQLLEKRISVPKLICPDGALAVTAGIDPGQKGFWFLSLAWLPGMIKHVLDYGFISLVGQNQDEQIREVREFVFSSRYYSFSGNVFYPIWRAGMDTGGGKDENDETMTERAYTIIRSASDGKRLLGTKGRSTSSVAKMNLTTIDKMPGKQGKPIPGGLNIWMLNTDAIKDSLSYFMGLPNGSPGSISFNQDVDNTLIKHILAEEKQKNRRGEWEWVQVSRDNHLLDCLVGAVAMGDRECWGGIEILKHPQRLKNQNIEEGSESVKSKTIIGRRIISKGIE